MAGYPHISSSPQVLPHCSLELMTAYAEENGLGLIQKNELPTPPKEDPPSEQPIDEVFTIDVTTAIIERDA